MTFWTPWDWGVDDTCPITGTRRPFGKWRVRLSRRLTGEEITRIRAHFLLDIGSMTPAKFERLLPEDVTILKSRDRLPLGHLTDDEIR